MILPIKNLSAIRKLTMENKTLKKNTMLLTIEGLFKKDYSFTILYEHRRQH